jgi:hypothetical protein
MAYGGRIGFAKAKSVQNIGRPPKLEGKTGKVVQYLEALPKGSTINKVEVAKLLNLGTAIKDGKEYTDTSLLTKIINRRAELKGKNFKFSTKTDLTVNKINDFVETFINENNKVPTQGEIQKGAKVDPTKLRTYIEQGKVRNVADTVFDRNTKAVNYILNTKKPTLSGLEKIIGEGNGSKLLTRVYINSLRSMTDKLNKVDEGRSVYKNYSLDQIELVKNKARKIPGFQSVYEREITDLVSDAYKNDKEKKTRALKKIAKFKALNKQLNKLGINHVLDHPLSYDFITKASQGVDPSELIRVRPLPERVNTFKSLLDTKLVEVGDTLRKTPGSNSALAAYNDIQSIAKEVGFNVGKISKKGTIISPQAAKIGDAPILPDVQKGAEIQNSFREFVKNVGNDPRMTRLGINLKELKDLSKLSKVNIAAYDRAIQKFIKKTGKFGIPLTLGYLGVRELNQPVQAAEAEAGETGTIADKLMSSLLFETGLSARDRAKIFGTAVAGDVIVKKGALTKASMKGLWKALPFIWTPMGDVLAHKFFSDKEPELADFAEGFKEAGYDINSEEFQKQWNSIPEEDRKEILYEAAGQVIDKRSTREKVSDAAASPWTHAQYAFWASGVKSMEKLLKTNPFDSVLKNKLKQAALFGIRMGIPRKVIKTISPIGWQLTAATTVGKVFKGSEPQAFYKDGEPIFKEPARVLPSMIQEYQKKHLPPEKRDEFTIDYSLSGDIERYRKDPDDLKAIAQRNRNTTPHFLDWALRTPLYKKYQEENKAGGGRAGYMGGGITNLKIKW